ncbi:MAG: GMC oxidoreductase, partial [Candidatus Caenarcaniphilales bacterium]|nr:GMC oxidoreductase [Candidatus Caenarcaniphilales bacterium]
NCQQTHETIFNFYLPPRLISHPELYQETQQSIFKELLSQNKDFCSTLSSVEEISFVRNKKALGSLSEDKLNDTLNSLFKSPESHERKIAFSLRSIYLSKIYSSALGETITGYKPKQSAHPDIDSYLKKYTPNFIQKNLKLNQETSSIQDTEKNKIDYLIIGSGPAGSVLAHELSKSGKRVVIIDQGPLILPGSVINSKIPQLRENLGVRVSEDGGIIFRNGRAVGGGAAINIDLAFPPTDELVQRRIRNWKTNNIIPQELWTKEEIQIAYNWVEKQLGTRKANTNEINSNNLILWEGTKKLGLNPDLYFLNSYLPRTSPSQIYFKRSPVDHLLFKALAKPNSSLNLIPRFKVHKLLLDKNKILGAEGEILEYPQLVGEIQDPHNLSLQSKKQIKIYAKTTILSAGALGSASILLRSKIDNPRIGKGIIAHASLPVIGLYKQPIKNWEGIASTVYLDDFALNNDFILEATSSEPNDVVNLIPGNGEQIHELMKDYSHLAGFGVMVIDSPDESNQVTLNESLEPRILYKLFELDKNKLLKGLDLSVKVHFAAGAQKVVIPNFQFFDGTRPNYVESLREWEAIKKNINFETFQNFVSSAHMQATCKMGKTKDISVVSPDHKVCDYENLYVVDSSIFPSSIGANPMQSIYTIAKIFSDKQLNKK